MTYLWNSFRMLVWMTILTGIAYPLIVTLVAQGTMKHTADGSLIVKNDTVIGSTLLAQKFESDKYFWPRPSAIDYNPLPSGGSNLGPTSLTLKKSVQERKSKYPDEEVPSLLLYASGSGLDPHISVKAANIQVDRIVKARGIDRQAVENLVKNCVEKRHFGFLGEPKINVLKLNLALDELMVTK